MCISYLFFGRIEDVMRILKFSQRCAFLSSVLQFQTFRRILVPSSSGLISVTPKTRMARLEYLCVLYSHVILVLVKWTATHSYQRIVPSSCVQRQWLWWFHGTTTVRHTGHVTTRYMICHPSVCISRNSGGSNKLPDDGRLLPKHVGANTYNKGVVQ
jgi:hypothetical protein